MKLFGDHDKTGVVSALTVFAPIVPGHEEAVREVIEGLPRGEASPLARLSQLHCSRLQIFDRLVHQGGGQKPDSLLSSWLVFTSSYDGELDAYLDAICDEIPTEADSWWSHCVGYPGTSDRAGFRRYVRSHHRRTDLFAAAYPPATVGDVREALALRGRLLDFVVDTQGLDAAALQQRFVAEFAGAR